jgi:hypothetical protein
MQAASLTVAICAAVISAVSATIAWLNTHPRPKLRGSLTTALPLGIAGDFSEGAAILLHCMLTNEVSQPVYVLGYRFKIKLKSGRWVMLNRPVTFSMPKIYVGEGSWEIEMKPENFIDWTPQQVQFGSPLMGFLVFFHEQPIAADDIRTYHLTVIDVFGREHAFSLDSDKALAFRNTPMMRNSGVRTHELFRLAGAIVRPVDKTADVGPGPG